MTQYGDGQGAGQQPGYGPPNQGPPNQGPPDQGQPAYGAPGQGQQGFSPQDRPRLGNQWGQQDYGRQHWGPKEHQPQHGQPDSSWDRPFQRDPNSPYGGYGAAYRNGYRLDPKSHRKLGVPGLVVTLLGIVALILGFTALDWLHQVSGDGLPGSAGSADFSGSKFSGIHSGLMSLHNGANEASTGVGKYLHFGVSTIYFSWLGWVLFAVAALAAIVSVLPTPATPAMRVLSLVAGLGGAGITAWAMDLFSVSGPVATIFRERLGSDLDYGYWLKHSYLGAWFTFGGFVVVAFGGLLGSSRQR